MSESKKLMVLWLKKPHAYTKKAESFCYVRFSKANTRDARLFWMNCHMLYDEIRIKERKAVNDHNVGRSQDFA